MMYGERWWWWGWGWVSGACRPIAEQRPHLKACYKDTKNPSFLFWATAPDIILLLSQ